MFSVGAASRAAAARRGVVRFDPHLARENRRLSRTVRRRRRRILRGLDRAGAGRRAAILGALCIGLASACASLGLQGIDLLGLPPANIFTAAPWKARSGDQSRAVAAARHRGYARRADCLAQSIHNDGEDPYCASHGRRRFGAGGERTRRDCISAMADTPVGVCARDWRGLLGGCAGAACRHGAAARRHAAVGAETLLCCRGADRRSARADRHCACLRSARKPFRADRNGYGVLLSIKLALVALLLALAAYNRYWLTPALDADSTRTRLLLRSVLTECLLALLILAVVAGWRFTPRPRALAAASDAPRSIHIHTDAAMLQVLIAPGKVGPDRSCCN